MPSCVFIYEVNQGGIFVYYMKNCKQWERKSEKSKRACSSIRDFRVGQNNFANKIPFFPFSLNLPSESRHFSR